MRRGQTSHNDYFRKSIFDMTKGIGFLVDFFLSGHIKCRLYVHTFVPTVANEIHFQQFSHFPSIIICYSYLNLPYIN